MKDNLLYEVEEVVHLADEKLPNCFREVRGELVIFKNDKERSRVRLIQFKVAGSFFRLLTNGLELNTLQIIILYAYRWQIELFFKSLKRTLNGLHLFNQSENGVGMQFYLLMTLALLLLKFKQQSEPQSKKKWKKALKNEAHPSEWIKEISEIFYESWKISKKWLLIVKNSLSKAVDNELLMLLDSC